MENCTTPSFSSRLEKGPRLDSQSILPSTSFALAPQALSLAPIPFCHINHLSERVDESKEWFFGLDYSRPKNETSCKTSMDSSRFPARRLLQVKLKNTSMQHCIETSNTFRGASEYISIYDSEIEHFPRLQYYPVYAKRSSLLSRSSSKSGDEDARVEHLEVLRLRSLSSRSCAESAGGDARRQENDLGEPFGEKDGATMT